MRMSNTIRSIKSVLWISTRPFSSYSKETVRVRFAPSPTGQLHLGGFRTALINYLFAKKHNGKFILRIEDTDQTRAVSGASQLIENDLEWLQIPPDESPRKGGALGPYTQSERLHLYQSFAEKMISSGHAYRCFCSEKRLELIKKNALRQRTKPMYDNKCRDLSPKQVSAKIGAGETYCIRFKYPPPPYQFDDYINGHVILNEPEGDFVILKSDKFPTYHLASVVDDNLMKVSHILRGIEWSVSTGKHINLYKALGLTPPVFAHLPLLLNGDGSKLSKRQGDISIEHYRKLNYYPEALANFVLCLTHTQKVDSLETMIANFDLESLSTRDQKLDFRNLDDLNQLCLKTSSSSAQRIEENLAILQSAFPDEDDGYYQRLIRWSPDRVARLQDVGNLYPFLSTRYWSAQRLEPQPEELQTLNSVLPHLERVFNENNRVTNELESIKEISRELRKVSRELTIEMKPLMTVLRRALCRTQEGPPVAEIIYLLGCRETMKRLMRRSSELAQELHQINSRSHC